MRLQREGRQVRSKPNTPVLRGPRQSGCDLGSGTKLVGNPELESGARAWGGGGGGGVLASLRMQFMQNGLWALVRAEKGWGGASFLSRRRGENQ